MKKEYAIYKGDKFLFMGTAQECAKHFNVKVKTVYDWACPSNHKRAKYGKNGKRKKECSGVKVAERV